MKSTLISLSLTFACATASLGAKSRPQRIVRRHVGLRPRQYGGYGSGYGTGSYGGGGGGGGGAQAGAYDSNSADTATAAAAWETTSQGWGDDSTTSGGYVSATATSESSTLAHETTTAHGAYQTTSAWKYGSGSYGNEQGGYDSCIQQCQVQYSGAGMTYAATATYDSAVATATASAWNATVAPAAGNGTALIAGPNQVVVAPMKGDLRMVPFNINAKKGSSIEFIWGAGPHTVTKSSLISICNATMDAPFQSGMQNATFKFPVTVESEETVPYFCGVPTHCQKGMFGLINGIVSTEPAKGYGQWMQGYAKKNPSFQKQWEQTQAACKGQDAAWKWGDMLDTSQMPEWAHPMAAEAILETKQFYAANPQILAAQTSNATDTSNSATDTSGAGGAPTATDAAGNSTSSSASGGIDLTGSAGRPLSAASSAVVGFAVVALVSLVLA